MLADAELERIAEMTRRYDREHGVEASFTAAELALETPRLLAAIADLRERLRQSEDARAEVSA